MNSTLTKFICFVCLCQKPVLFAIVCPVANIYNVEGEEILDFVISWGPGVLGHAPERVVKAVQEELENLRKAPFQTLNTTYTFYATGTLANLSLGRVVIDNATNTSFYRVDAGMCWKQRNSRIIGECRDNNGTLVFNDTNSNGILDSPVQLTTYMAQR